MHQRIRKTPLQSVSLVLIANTTFLYSSNSRSGEYSLQRTEEKVTGRSRNIWDILPFKKNKFLWKKFVVKNVITAIKHEPIHVVVEFLKKVTKKIESFRRGDIITDSDQIYFDSNDSCVCMGARPNNMSSTSLPTTTKQNLSTTLSATTTIITKSTTTTENTTPTPTESTMHRTTTDHTATTTTPHPTLETDQTTMKPSPPVWVIPNYPGPLEGPQSNFGPPLRPISTTLKPSTTHPPMWIINPEFTSNPDERYPASYDPRPPGHTSNIGELPPNPYDSRPQAASVTGNTWPTVSHNSRPQGPAAVGAPQISYNSNQPASSPVDETQPVVSYNPQSQVTSSTDNLAPPVFYAPRSSTVTLAA